MIYGLPGQTLEEWQENLDDAIRLEIPHISAYHLIYEEGTALYKLMEAGKVTPIEEDLSVTLFSTLINRLTEAGYLHYEISNFGRPGYFSRHNSSYWTGTKYIGIGPSAHSYNGESRQWNISSLPRYLQGIKAGIPDIEIEELDINTKYNDLSSPDYAQCGESGQLISGSGSEKKSKPISNSRQLPICVKGCLSVKTTL